MIFATSSAFFITTSSVLLMVAGVFVAFFIERCSQLLVNALSLSEPYHVTKQCSPTLAKVRPRSVAIFFVCMRTRGIGSIVSASSSKKKRCRVLICRWWFLAKPAIFCGQSPTAKLSKRQLMHLVNAVLESIDDRLLERTNERAEEFQVTTGWRVIENRVDYWESYQIYKIVRIGVLCITALLFYFAPKIKVFKSIISVKYPVISTVCHSTDIINHGYYLCY